MEEIWKPVPGYEGLYDVSNHGRVRSHDQILNRKNGTVRWKGKVLKRQRGSKGHYGVNLHKDGKSKTHYIHRLVAEQFLDNPEQHPLVRHLDDVKENNHVSNLAWGTHADNMQDAIRNGRNFNRQLHKTHCPKGHPYSGDNLYLDPKKGRRHCIECKKISYDKDGKRLARERRKRGLAEDNPRHGTLNGYSNYGCRCEPCSEAGILYNKGRGK